MPRRAWRRSGSTLPLRPSARRTTTRGGELDSQRNEWQRACAWRVMSESVVREGSTAATAESGRAAARPPHVLFATCCVVFALSIDPLLWMMGVDIPTRAFGAGWVDYRIFTTTTTVLLVACMLIGGLLGDYFGRRRVLLLVSVLTTVGGLLIMVA